nr:MAG TPA: Protein of unknown function (DUF1331) [Bacteriophage sp.]
MGIELTPLTGLQTFRVYPKVSTNQCLSFPLFFLTGLTL